MAVTLKDVADAAHVSTTTVSRIINNDETLKVSDETRELVHEQIKVLGYKTKTKATIQKNIALVTALSEERSVNDAYWQSVCLSIERQAQDVNITNLIRLTDKKPMHYLAKYDAIILVGDISADSVKKLREINTKIVTVDSKAINHNVTNVAPDFTTSMVTILNQFKQAGRTNIAYIGGVNELQEVFSGENQQQADDRYYTYQNWMTEQGLPMHSYLRDWDAQTGYMGVEQVFTEEEMIDALIVGSDIVALGAMKRLKEMEIAVPQQTVLVSFDNLEFAEYSNPSLTSVDLKIDALAQMALEQAKQIAVQDRDWIAHIKIPGKIIYRESFSEK